MTKRETIYLLLVISLLTAYYFYSSNNNTKEYTVYNQPPSIDRFDIAPPVKRVDEGVQFAIAVTNHTHREIYDIYGPDLDEYKPVEALTASILIAKGGNEIVSDKLVIQRLNGNSGVFHYAWTPREPGEYRVTIQLASQNPWVYYDTFQGQTVESVTQEKTFAVMGD